MTSNKNKIGYVTKFELTILERDLGFQLHELVFDLLGIEHDYANWCWNLTYSTAFGIFSNRNSCQERWDGLYGAYSCGVLL